MLRTLITGGAGFIGSHTADALLASGHEVRILDSLAPPVHRGGWPDYLSSDCERIHADVRDPDALARALEGVDNVFHLAAYQDYLPDFSTFFDVNVTSTARLFEIIVRDRLPVQRVVVASSQFVQGEGLYVNARGETFSPYPRSREQLERGNWELLGVNGEPLQWQWTSETHAAPVNAYSLSKHAQEQQALCFGRQYGIPVVVMRYSIVQGARQSIFNTYSGACRVFSLCYHFGRQPHIYEDGLQRRDFVNIFDVVAANVLVLTDLRAAGQVFCVGGGTACTLREFDRVVARVFDREDVEPIVSGEFRFGDTRNACSDTRRLQKLGWAPRRSIEDSVRQYREYLEAIGPEAGLIERSMQHMRQLGVVGSVR